MKKDKPFAEKGDISSIGWHVGYEPLEPMTKEPWPHMTICLERANIYLNCDSASELRKFIKALRKGLRRLEK